MAIDFHVKYFIFILHQNINELQYWQSTSPMYRYNYTCVCIYLINIDITEVIVLIKTFLELLIVLTTRTLIYLTIHCANIKVKWTDT
jgi:hypothetical protein